LKQELFIKVLGPEDVFVRRKVFKVVFPDDIVVWFLGDSGIGCEGAIER
jgi:hypothetical protein